MLCWLFRCFQFCRLTDPIVLITETCAVQALDDVRHGVVEVVGRSQHIGHIECALRMLARMGQTENPSQNLLLALRLCLKQRDRTDIFARLGVLRICNFFQLVPQVNRVNQHLGLAVPVVDDHGQLDHVFVFQLHRVHIGDGAVGLAQHLCKRGKIAVLLIGFQDLFAAPTEGVVGQHHNRQLLRYGSGVEVLPVQKLLLGVDLHASAEIHVDFLTVGMGRVFQGFYRLRQNRVRGNKPHDRFCLSSGERVKDGANGVAGNKGLAAARRHLEAEVRNTGYHVLV